MSAADSDPEQQKQDEQRTRRWATAAAVVAVLLILLWILLQYVGVVPSTIGMSRARSVELIEAAGFQASESTVAAGPRLSGLVVEQAPFRGLYFTFWPVRITVTAGGSGAPVGSMEVTPTATLGGIDLLETAAVSPEREMPKDAEEVDALFKPKSSELIMPNVLNNSTAKALDKLRRAGLRISIRSGASTTKVKQGKVMYQTPPPGAIIERGQSSMIWVSTGVLDVTDGSKNGARPPGNVYLEP